MKAGSAALFGHKDTFPAYSYRQQRPGGHVVGSTSRRVLPRAFTAVPYTVDAASTMPKTLQAAVGSSILPGPLRSGRVQDDPYQISATSVT